MIEKLRTIVEQSNPRVLGQVVKSKSHPGLYEWVLSETSIFPENTTVTERVYYILNGKPNPFCPSGEKKRLKPDSGYGFCNKVPGCACFQAYIKENREPHSPEMMEHILEKRKETWKEKYGEDNPAKHQSIKDKRKQTMSKRDYSEQRKQTSYNKTSIGFEQVINRVKEKVTPEFTREEYIGSNRLNKYPWKCIQCDHRFQSHIDYGTVPICRKCYPKTRSIPEIEIGDFVSGLGFDIVTNDTDILNGLELDIYIPSKKIAIEHNGIYWHSDIKKKSNYHVDKYIKCKKLGIHLIQIFENEWHGSRDIIEARLKSVLGVSNKLYARKCSISEITPKLYKKFCEENHLYGNANAKFKYGLFFENNLVATMSFSKSRFTKNAYELVRYCSSGTVVGGASKLFKHFISELNPTEIVSYADRCWSNGNLYKSLGFMEITTHENNVGYWYLKNGIRYHRASFTKKRLVKMGHDPMMSEPEIMKQLGYLVFYDCGNSKWLWTKT